MKFYLSLFAVALLLEGCAVTTNPVAIPYFSTNAVSAVSAIVPTLKLSVSSVSPQHGVTKRNPHPPGNTWTNTATIDPTRPAVMSFEWTNLACTVTFTTTTNQPIWKLFAGTKMVAWGLTTNKTETAIDTNNFPFALYHTEESSSFSIRDFSARGDMVKFQGQMTAGSPLVTSTHCFDSNVIGEVFQSFNSGPSLTVSNDPPWLTIPFYGHNTNFDNSLVVTQEDLLCFVTNVTDGTNLWVSIYPGRSGQFTCKVANNDASAIQATIDASSSIVGQDGITNVMIEVPAGCFLAVSPQMMNPNYVLQNINCDGNHALSISSGGLTIVGHSNSVLEAVGAQMSRPINSSFPYGNGMFCGMLGSLIYTVAPVANSQYPLVFTNLTLDGGVLQGNQPYSYWILYQGNNEGWSTGHHAVVDYSTSPCPPAQPNTMKRFLNCRMIHWRGEMLITTVGRCPGCTNDVENCTFYDGNASGDNLGFAQIVVSNVFDTLEQATEIYQYNAVGPSIFEDNVITNMTTMLVLNGARTNVVPDTYTIANNVFWGWPSGHVITLEPGCNVIISNNVFHGQTGGVNFTGAGLQPTDGSAAVMSNVVIVANTFNDTFLPVYMDGYPVEDVLVSHNTKLGGQQFAFCQGGWKTNIVFSGNSSTGGAILASDGVQSGSYFTDSTNDTLGPYSFGDPYGVTNQISYGNGGRQVITEAMTNSVFLLQVSPLIPLGAQLTLSNAALMTADVNLAGTNAGALPPSSAQTFFYDGSHWHE